MRFPLLRGLLVSAGLMASTTTWAQTLKFSGYEWRVRSGVGNPGPSMPNYWNSSNAYVDGSGALHLKITKQDGIWYSAEIECTRTLGFGRYQFQVAGRLDQLDKNVVLGLFSYRGHPDSTNELDIEFSRWGNAAAPPASFTVHPAVAGTKHFWEFGFPYAMEQTTHRYDWASRSVMFQSLDGYRDDNTGVFQTWSYLTGTTNLNDQPTDIPQLPMIPLINLWLLDGQAPSDGKEVEVVINRFTFIPVTMVLQNQADRRIALLSVHGNQFTESRPVYPTVPADWRAAAAADFDQDGNNDVVVQNTQTRAVSILFIKGYQVQASVPIKPVLPADWRVMAAGDVNGDGQPDILVQNTVTQKISALLMNGTTMVQSKSFSSGLSANWSIVGAADFSGDGLTDLVAQNVSTREIRILSLNGTTITGGALLAPTLPPNWLVGGVRDYDGDGRPDLAVQNSSTLQIAVLSVVDMKIRKSYSLSPTVLTGWQLVGPK